VKEIKITKETTLDDVIEQMEKADALVAYYSGENKRYVILPEDSYANILSRTLPNDTRTIEHMSYTEIQKLGMGGWFTVSTIPK
jgi:hypothetical protein